MPRKAMDTLTEAMYYVLLAFQQGEMCGVEVTDYVSRQTAGRVSLGPATLYTILGKFETEGYLREVAVEGRKRTYAITDRGIEAYRQELARLHQCIYDGEHPVPLREKGEDYGRQQYQARAAEA